MKKFTVCSFGVLAIGVVVFMAAGASRARRGANRQFRPAGYTLVQVEKQVFKDGQIPLTAICTRYVASDGQWKLIRQASLKSGRVTVSQLFGTSKGTFLSTGNDGDPASATPSSLQFMSVWLPPDATHYSDQYYRTWPKFSREEQLLGYTAYVMHDNFSPDSWVETAFIPELGQFAVRTVEQTPEYTVTTEPIYIDLHEPTPEFLQLPKAPESFDLIHREIGDAEKSGQSERAGSLRSQEDEHKRASQ